MNANAKSKSIVTKHRATSASVVSPEYIVQRLGQDVRNSILVVSVLINLFILIGWLVIQVSTRYDAALINYLQNK